MGRSANRLALETLQTSALQSRAAVFDWRELSESGDVAALANILSVLPSRVTRGLKEAGGTPVEEGEKLPEGLG
jgi:hypothetical protein